MVIDFYGFPQAIIGVDECPGGDSGFSNLLHHPWLRLVFTPNSASRLRKSGRVCLIGAVNF